MKQLLIILLFPIAGLGQTERIKIDTTGRLIFNEIDSTGTTQINYDLLTKYYIGRSLTAPSRPVMDTARVMIIYCDTTNLSEKPYSMFTTGYTINNTFTNFIPFVFCQKGYHVTYKIYMGEMNDPDLTPGSLIWRPITVYNYKHVAYLDEKKKPLSKSVVVFMSLKAE